MLQVRLRKLDVNSYCMLRAKRMELVQCEFCNETFNNRYSSIIHNVYHIIIPLIKLKVQQCPECLYYFQSSKKLYVHLKKNHNKNNRIKEIIDVENITESKNTNKENKITELEEIIEKEEIIEIQKITELDKIKCVKEMRDLEVIKNDTGDHRDILSPLYIPKIETNHIYPIQNGTLDEKHTFETEEYILPDVCHAAPTINSLDGKHHIPNLGKSARKTVTENELDLLSEHYDKLISPVISRCKYCGMEFPNRFKSIEHEVTHMRFRKGRPYLCTICDMYIAGNHWQLTKHVAEKHPHRTDRPRTRTICQMCGLKYHKYMRHLMNYHPNIIDMNPRDLTGFGGNVEPHVKRQMVNSSVFNICRVCLPFLKKKINLKYIIVGRVHQMGMRHTCEKCKRLFFEINLVMRMKWAKRSVDKLHFEEDLPKRKPYSNNERLRNIQQRLKKLNKL